MNRRRWFAAALGAIGAGVSRKILGHIPADNLPGWVVDDCYFDPVRNIRLSNNVYRYARDGQIFGHSILDESVRQWRT